MDTALRITEADDAHPHFDQQFWFARKLATYFQHLLAPAEQQLQLSIERV
jgi:hypothetical protein